MFTNSYLIFLLYGTTLITAELLHPERKKRGYGGDNDDSEPYVHKRDPPTLYTRPQQLQQTQQSNTVRRSQDQSLFNLLSQAGFNLPNGQSIQSLFDSPVSNPQFTTTTYNQQIPNGFFSSTLQRGYNKPTGQTSYNQYSTWWSNSNYQTGQGGFNRPIDQSYQNNYNQPISPSYQNAQGGYNQPNGPYYQNNQGYNQPTYPNNQGFNQPTYPNNQGFNQPTYQNNQGFNQPTYQNNQGFNQPITPTYQNGPGNVNQPIEQPSQNVQGNNYPLQNEIIPLDQLSNPNPISLSQENPNSILTELADSEQNDKTRDTSTPKPIDQDFTNLSTENPNEISPETKDSKPLLDLRSGFPKLG